MLQKVRSFFQSDLIQDSGIYTLSSIFEKAIPFLLLPVLTRYLSTEDYGIVSMFTVLVGLTIPFTGLGIKPAVLRSYHKEEIDFSAYVSNVLLILVFSTATVLALFLLFSDFISKYSEFPSNWLMYVVIVAAAQFIINIVLVVWQAQYKAMAFGAFNISVTALNLGISVFLIVQLGFGWEGRVLGQVVAVVLFAVLGIFILWEKGLIKFQLVKEYIRHALGYGIPLIPHILSSFAITMIDRVFITNMVGIGETGVYTVGYQMGMIIGVLATAFNTAWTPWLYNKLNEGGAAIKKKIVKFTYFYMVIILVAALILTYISPWFMSFFVGKEFQGATNFILWIALGYSFNGMYYMVTNYIFYTEKTYLISWISFVTALINLVLNYFFIKMFGAIGAAQATTIAFFMQFILTWIISQKIYSMPWLSSLRLITENKP